MGLDHHVDEASAIPRPGDALRDGIERARLALSQGKAATLAYTLGVSVADVERLGGVGCADRRAADMSRPGDA